MGEIVPQMWEKGNDLILESLYTDSLFIYSPSQIALTILKIISPQFNFDFPRYKNKKQIDKKNIKKII